MPQSKPELSDFLKKEGLETFLSLFQENEVDFATLEILSDADLKELGLPFGPRKKLLNALVTSRKAQDAESRNHHDPEEHHQEDDHERRQLTALFCDMVGFTDLAGKVDAETLDSVIGRYEQDCARCIERFGGHILHCLGDGIIALFGFPIANEAATKHAVDAGFAIIEILKHVHIPQIGRMRVRVGIDNGMVIVSSGENRAIGEALNIAARLQSIAEPDKILISDQARRLVIDSFEFLDVGDKSLKGVARPIRAFELVRPLVKANRSQLSHRTDLSPLIGRTKELALLNQRWQQTQAGNGQLVLITGEPGIGKSRVVNALQAQIESERGRTLTFYCSALYSDSPFYPFIQMLEGLLDWEEEPSIAVRLDKLETFMVHEFGRSIEDVRLTGALLGLPCDERYGPIELTPIRRKQATITALVNLIEAIARSQKCLLILEDLHWCDPSTLDFLDHLILRISDFPVLAVLTARPEFHLHQPQRPYFSTIQLTKLDASCIEALVSRIIAENFFSKDLIRKIVEKTDGVPLFVEELTKSILESRNTPSESPTEGPYLNASEVEIPPTLRDLLMARLDRVPEVKEAAQIGSVIGREFSYRLISAVSPRKLAALNIGLKRLVSSGLASQHGEDENAIYTFKHALIQDTAYDSLLKGRRKELHGTIAQLLEDDFPEIRDSEPEILARHYTEAELHSPAVVYWHRAGELAMHRFAHREAGHHLEKGLTLVATLPESPDRSLKELKLRTLLAPAEVARVGWASTQITPLLEPALALAKSLHHRPSLIPTLHGLWVNALTRGTLTRSVEIAENMLKTASDLSYSSLQICGHRALMTSNFWCGNLVGARAQGDAIRAIYDPAIHGNISKLTNSDPLTGDGIYRPQYLWILGFPDQAIEACQANHIHARQLNHPFDLAFSLTLGAQVYGFCGQPSELLDCAAEGELLGNEHGVPVMSEILAEISKGVAWLRAENALISVAQLQSSLDRLIQSGQRIWVPYIRSLLADALIKTGNPQEALKLLELSLDDVASNNEYTHFPEILRIKATALLNLQRTEEAESLLLAAIAYAQKQQSKSWELRAATTLAELYAKQSSPQKAIDVLAPVFNSFTEGFGTRDLLEAKSLLQHLGTLSS
ncbi:MAG: AAA family ATPase [Verrucomicrobiota bacterium]